MKTTLPEKYKPGEFMGLVEEGLDDEQMLLPEQREKLRQNAFVNYSCARQILRSAKQPCRPKAYCGGRIPGDGIPGRSIFEQDSVEVVLYRLGKPTVTQKRAQTGCIRQ